MLQSNVDIGTFSVHWMVDVSTNSNAHEADLTALNFLHAKTFHLEDRILGELVSVGSQSSLVSASTL